MSGEREKSAKASPLIGTYAEKSLHAFLKNGIDSDSSHHERECCGYVADILDGQSITEVQTKAFAKLPRKLEAYLSAGYSVRVVYPFISRKYLSFADSETGELSEPRLSPYKGNIFAVTDELWHIRRFAGNEKIRFTVIALSVTEIRRRSTRGDYSRKGYFLLERLPREIYSVSDYEKPEDYLAFLPPGLPDTFRASQLGSAAHLRGRRVYSAVNFLADAGIITAAGREGRAALYKVNDLYVDKYAAAEYHKTKAKINSGSAEE